LGLQSRHYQRIINPLPNVETIETQYCIALQRTLQPCHLHIDSAYATVLIGHSLDIILFVFFKPRIISRIWHLEILSRLQISANMLFEKLRRRSKSSTKPETAQATSSDKPETAQATSSDKPASQNQSKAAHVTTISAMSTLVPPDEPGEAREFLAFIEKTKREEERKNLLAIKEAERKKRDCNMSPWAGRM
jgi:hypothetical protein